MASACLERSDDPDELDDTGEVDAHLLPATGSIVTLTNACGNKVLDIAGAEAANGARAHLWSSHGGGNQKFKIADAGGGFIKLIAQHSNKLVEVDDANKSNGATVQQWADANAPQQQWKMVEKSPGRFTFEARHAPGMFLDAHQAGTSDGTRVQIWTRNDSCAQQWTVAGSTTNPPPASAVIFGVNDGSGYDDSQAFNDRVSAALKGWGLESARMGMDNVGCARASEACSFVGRDRAVNAHLAQGIAIHAVIAFRGGVDKGANVDEWAANYGSKCGKIAAHYKTKVRYYIVDNEPDLDYQHAPKVSPDVLVKMQKACYQAIKAVDGGILVESSPATSPETSYNRDALAKGLGTYADIIGTHMYGGQLERDAIGTLRGYMSEFGVNKPVACSECGVDPTWYDSSPYFGQYGKDARALWLRNMAKYARDKKLHNVQFFSVFSIHGNWEMNGDPKAESALYDIGHGNF